MRVVYAALLFIALVTPPFGPTAPAQAGNCEFVLGFKTLHDVIPDIVGDCKTNEYHNPENGDGLQETAGADGKGGLLVWRKADNWTAYTDGYRTWVNGPYGLQKRLNTERFPWEAAAVPCSRENLQTYLGWVHDKSLASLIALQDVGDTLQLVAVSPDLLFDGASIRSGGNCGGKGVPSS